MKSINADRVLLLGNLFTIAGSAAVGVGTVLWLSSGAGLPPGKSVFSNPGTTENQGSSGPVTRLRSAEDYFSI